MLVYVAIHSLFSPQKFAVMRVAVLEIAFFRRCSLRAAESLPSRERMKRGLFLALIQPITIILGQYFHDSSC